MRLEFKIGEKFDSWDELNNAFCDFEESTGCVLATTSSRYISAQKRRCNYFLKPELKFSEIKKCCNQGGRNPSKNGKIVSSIQTGCPFFIYVHSNKLTQTLDVISTNMNHNHKISKIFYKIKKQKKIDC